MEQLYRMPDGSLMLLKMRGLYDLNFYQDPKTGKSYTTTKAIPTGRFINVKEKEDKMKTTSSEFKNMKFRVKDEEHSKQIQEYLFNSGYKWSSGNNVKKQDKSFLFANSDGGLGWDDNLSYFEEHEHAEYQLKETKSYSLEEVKSITTLGIDLNVEVTINGGKISLKDLKELLSKE